MSTKHTPGPWKVEPRGNLKARQFVEAGEFRIVECLTRDQEANAHLIAAAPELLAALKDLLASAGYCEPPTMERARAAIVKAESR